jgi:serine phosphatase RsbU (regulator of sigma subunit)/anti-sigma regulatory factor (Ser/Thr protein kinase)
MDFVAGCAAADGFTPRRIKEIQLAVEEAVVNVVHHAYPGGGGSVELRWLKSPRPPAVLVEIEDAGPPFDMRSAAPPDLEAGIAERKVGGLGIYFITRMADAVDYRREKDRNILTLTVRPDKDGGGPAPAGPGAPPADDDLRFPLESMRRETFKKGEVLFKRGDPADKMYYITGGCLRLLEIDKIVRAGEVIGEMGILSPFQARTASASCEEDLEAYTIGREDVIRLFSRDSDLAFRLVHLCIKRFIENLRAETEAKERIQSELRIARDIQVSMLPRVFPPFPDRPEFDIFAVMEPAKEVGGDFFDFFLIDENRLGVVIGDVSGKGVPAALFMAICKTLLKTEALRGLPPEEVLARVNRTLIPDNETLMFVTVFLLVLNVRTGEMRFANGGHPRPLLSAGPERFEFLAGPTGVVLGAVDGAPFPSGVRTLKPGEIVYLYTDGMSEAMNAGKELFSDDRLKDSLSAGAGKPVAELVRHMRDAVLKFADGEAPSDDITMVALQFRGK